MRPVRIPGATREFKAPADWDDERQGKCGGLAIADVTVENTVWMVSQWELSPAELAALAAGGKIRLWISAPLHPVIGLTVVSPEEQNNAIPSTTDAG